MHEIHECCWCICQSKGHHCKLKVPITRPERCLRDICLPNPELMVTSAKAYLGVDLLWRPRARPDPVGRSEPKPRGRPVEVINQILLVIALLNLSFQKCRDPNPRLDPVGGSKPEPDLLRHFQLSYQNIWLVLFILDFVITLKHFIFGQTHKTFTHSKRLITLTFSKMYFTKILIQSSNCFTKCQCLKEME